MKAKIRDTKSLASQVLLRRLPNDDPTKESEVDMIDWGQVKSLRDEVGPEDFEEVVELFLEEVEEVVERLKVSADTSTLEDDMHFLKGSAMNLGFESFSRLCQDGENLSAQGEADTLDVGSVLACYASSKAVFLNDLPNAIQ
jgi:HPt (histidine-containing phosphotransfer) domain-containing protein